MSYERTIRNLLDRAPALKAGETGLVGVDLDNGYVIRVEYTTVNGANLPHDKRVVTSESWDWEKAGCSNNEEWRAYLNKHFWDI